MALGKEKSIVLARSGLDESVDTKLRNLKTGHTIGFGWDVPADVSAKLVPLREKRDRFLSVLKMHKDGAKGKDGKPVNLSEKQQIAFGMAINQIGEEMIAVIRKAINSDATQLRAQLKTLAAKLPNTDFALSVKTSVNPDECRFAITAMQIGTYVDTADAMLSELNI